MKPIRLAVMSLIEAKKFQDNLKEDGVEILLNHNEQTCSRGCTVTVEVLGYEKDLEYISKNYNESHQKLLEGHNVDWDIANSIFDENAQYATCPACGFSFDTTSSECPDCGLVI